MKLIWIVVLIAFAFVSPSVAKADGCDSPLDCPELWGNPPGECVTEVCVDPPAQPSDPLGLPITSPDGSEVVEIREQPDNPLNEPIQPPPYESELVFYRGGLKFR